MILSEKGDQSLLSVWHPYFFGSFSLLDPYSKSGGTHYVVLFTRNEVLFGRL